MFPFASPASVPSAYGMPETPLSLFAKALRQHQNSDWAWAAAKETIAGLARLNGARRAIEIGGGRDPLFSAAETSIMGMTLTLNDISANELRFAPPGFPTACFDIAGLLPRDQVGFGTYDLAFSRMVFEHVKDANQAWTNVYNLLTPGGVGFAFIPTLYTLPFLVNRLMPETLSQAVVRMLYPHRTDHADPKFPAFYDMCFASEKKLRPMFERIGFKEFYVVPFHGHDYFKSLPGLRELDRFFNNMAAAGNWTTWASYAFIMARK